MSEIRRAAGEPESKASLAQRLGGLGNAKWVSWLPLVPSIIFFVVFLIVPMIVSFYNSLTPNVLVGAPPGTRSLANYLYFFQRSYYVSVLVRTLRFSLVVTLAALVVGYATALAIRRLGPSVGSTLVLVLAFPILAGPIVTVLGWMIMFIRGGIATQIVSGLRSLLSLPLQTRPLLGTDLAVEVSLFHFVLAFVVLNILNGLLTINPYLEEAAMTLGATPWQTFRHVIWPLSLPGVLSASLIAFSLCMNAFVNPLFLGGDTQLVMTTLISQYMLTSFNWQMASTAAVILVVVSLSITVSYNKFVTNAIR